VSPSLFSSRLVRWAGCALALLGTHCKPHVYCDAPSEKLLKHVPEILSGTGLYSDVMADVLAPDVRPFSPRYALWRQCGR
jgi:hypothetical protein